MPNELEKFFLEQNKELEKVLPTQKSEKFQEAIKKFQGDAIREAEDLNNPQFNTELQAQWKSLFQNVTNLDELEKALDDMTKFFEEKSSQVRGEEVKAIIASNFRTDPTVTEESFKAAIDQIAQDKNRSSPPKTGTPPTPAVLPKINSERFQAILAANTENYEKLEQSVDSKLRLSDKDKREQLIKISIQFAEQEAALQKPAAEIINSYWFWQSVITGNKSWQNLYVAEHGRQLQKVAMGRSPDEATKKLDQLGQHLLAIDTAVKEALEKARQLPNALTDGITSNVTNPNLRDAKGGLDHEKIRQYVTSRLYEAMASNPDCIKHGPTNIIEKIRSISILNDPKAAKEWRNSLGIGITSGDTLEKFIEDFIKPIPKSVAETMPAEPGKKEKIQKKINKVFRKQRKDVNLLHECFSGACLYELDKGSKKGTTVYETLAGHLKETRPGSSWMMHANALHEVSEKEAADINTRVSQEISQRSKEGALNLAEPQEKSEKKLSYSFDNTTKSAIDMTHPIVNISSRNGKIDIEVVGAFSGVVRIPRINEYGEPIDNLYDVFEFKKGLLMASVKLDNLHDANGRPTGSQVGKVKTDLGVMAKVVSAAVDTHSVGSPPSTPIVKTHPPSIPGLSSS